ncbi:hypothetical protein B296_00002943 [Ensete ventricosum]|uniref:Uncharacterized protein n=1 Tax=Ensete ventricosum TaxID=4639 RepID=A0A426XG61_ENSVE|nr:hypothetical protein B296_00002943 [Ensete ventricosum]
MSREGQDHVKSKKFTPTWSPPTWSKSLIVLVASGIVPSSPSPLPHTPLSKKGIDDFTEVPPLRYHGAAKPIALLSVALHLHPFLRNR